MLTTGEGQEPETTTANGQESEATNSAGQDSAPSDEIRKLRAEAAKYRVERNELRQWREQNEAIISAHNERVEAEKSELEKAQEQMKNYQSELDALKQQNALAEKRIALTALGQKAGVPAEAIALLNVDSFDLSDEAATLELLKTLAPNRPKANGGGASNPAQSPSGGALAETPEQWFKRMRG